MSVKVLYINKKLEKYFIQNRFVFFTVISLLLLLLLLIDQDILNKNNIIICTIPSSYASYSSII